MKQLFARVKPDGGTPLGKRLKEVTDKLVENVENDVDHKKTNCLVITDGRPCKLRMPVSAEQGSCATNSRQS